MVKQKQHPARAPLPSAASPDEAVPEDVDAFFAALAEFVETLPLLTGGKVEVPARTRLLAAIKTLRAPAHG